MRVNKHTDKAALGAAAAAEGIAAIKQAIADKGETAIILATGASQFEMMEVLIKADIDWSRVTAFHLDEYIGLPDSHKASFRRYLKERFLAHVPTLKEFVFVEGDAADTDAELARLNKRISEVSIDVAFAGIGENCHLAFNDPPADFDTDAPYIVVNLDTACRQQQFGEGWFETLDDVPAQAISMSIQQILKSANIVLSVPDARKAQAVKNAVEGKVSNLHPASILQTHDNTTLHLDAGSASALHQAG